jgi:chromosome segregation ATPase
LLVCFGVPTKTTERGKNRTDFIKTGCTSCTIQVTLKNHGDGAFEPALYGSRITVERRINRANKATCRLFDQEMAVIRESPTELKRMLLHFNLQVRSKTLSFVCSPCIV